ncbi:HAMP domain-containing histidine kinase [Paenibacillus sp. N1-5-1-14]|uniref:HAMP domain-containing sensor histidine kinase n=1 Tax=Paenibacillus radicibacter TaxID=2972488 RepID=UPI002158AB9D|nr:HAMP domain-containing sensor histidine kinase [Paenibacillus radicibacter]MCR8643415.1 HAMP domain-containing histidine kinase [Paenibacillus radicibacter]
MRIRWLIVLIMMMLLGGGFLSYLTLDTKVNTELDMVMVNDIVKTFEDRSGQVVQDDFHRIKQDFALIDAKGELLFETSQGLFTSLHNAIKEHSVMVDLNVQGNYAGKLILPSSTEQLVHQMKDKLMMVIVETFSSLIVLCAGYAIYLNQAVFKPFKQMERFAKYVARGDLNIPLEMRKNNPFGAFTESFDMMREQLAAARQSEYEANRSKKELVATLSHDIKTPVASIKAVTELMLVRASEDKVIHQLNMINIKADQIHLLVTDMFHATLEELEELKVMVTEEMSDVLSGMIESVNYDGKISCDRIPSCIILADVNRLQQVIDNVISNAYKYAGTSIQIASQIRDNYLEIHVMDYGKGAAAEEIPLLFNKFYRGGNIEGFIGSGLGLYISKYFMQKMQGHIECLNRPDGFTVVLRLKLA